MLVKGLKKVVAACETFGVGVKRNVNGWDDFNEEGVDLSNKWWIKEFEVDR